MKIKVSNTTSLQLDWLVAKAQGFDVHHSAMLNGHIMHGFWVSGYYPGDLNSWVPLNAFRPHDSWSQGGPILTKARISRTIDHSGLWIAYWTDGYGEDDFYKKWMQCDRSELVAGLRCYVASKLGEEVEVPDELA